MDTLSGFPRMSPQDLYNKMSHGEQFVLIDTLPEEHFECVHIPGALNACVFEVTFLDTVKGIAPQKETALVVYGSSPRSMDAVTAGDKVIRAGYRNVSVLEGGLAAWQESHYPLEGTRIELLAPTGEGCRIAAGAYRVDCEQSVVEWTGRNPNKKHYGTIPLENGELTVKNGTITGSFTLDMAGMKNVDLAGNEWLPVLLSHLKSDDFFFVSLFPKAVFTLRAATPIPPSSLGSPNFEVSGALELRGSSNEITFPATVHPLPEGGMAIEAHFDIDRTHWKILYGSARFFEHLGMHLVFDLISIQMCLVLQADPLPGGDSFSG